MSRQDPSSASGGDVRAIPRPGARRRLRTFGVMVCAGLLLACAGAGGSAAQTSKSADAIAGTWTRPVPGEASAREGIVLAEGGVLGLIGAPALHGLAWRLEADHLVLTTGTARRPHPRDQRLRFSLPKPGTLVLTAAGGDVYLAGEYRRDDAAAGRLSGTVTHRRTDPLPPTAVLHVALSDVSRVDTSAVDIAWRAIPVEGRRVPMAFDLFYDRSAIDPSRSYALRASITDGGQRIFITKIPYPVITHGAPDRAAMVVTPFSEPHSPELTRGEHARLRGIVSLVPGPSRFLDCASGREVPVVETDGYPAVEDTWIHARLGPDDPVLMSVEGHYDLRDAQDGAGREMALLVTRALRGWPTRTCTIPPDVEVEGREWILLDVDGRFARSVSGTLPRIRILPEGRRVEGHTGCNPFTGTYRIEGTALVFSIEGSDLAACEGTDQETAFLYAIQATANFRVTGEVLMLYREETRLARLRAATTP